MSEDGPKGGRPRHRFWSSKGLVNAAVVLLWVIAAALTVTTLMPDARGPGSELAGEGALPLMVPVEQRLSFEDSEVEQLGRAALDQIDYPWGARLPQWTIEFKRGDTEIAGYTWSRQDRIEVFVRPGDDMNTVARVLAHELGHAIDVAHNDADERRQWLNQRGASDDRAWWPHSGAADFETGAGDFAEVFTAWQLGTEDFRSRLAGPPTADDLLLLERLANG